MRAWFNGRMGASQALDEGSIPFARFFKGKDMAEEEKVEEAPDLLEFETHKSVQSGNKDLWLFLIIIDVVCLCVFGFLLYKNISAKLLVSAAAPEVVQEEVFTVEQTPAVSETTVIETAVSVPEIETVEVLTPEPVISQTVMPEETSAPIAQAQEPATENTFSEKKQSVLVQVNPKSKYRQVTFRYFGEAKSVAIVSGFTMAKPRAMSQKNGAWETTLAISPGTYKYLFVVDGVQRTDPYAEQKDGRSVLVVK